jgi:aquaporin Z
VRSALAALRQHWPEYLIEAWALGMFMISAALLATLLEYPASPIHRWITDPLARRVVAGIAMGLTAIALIHSPWGKRSGAHMNPAVTLTFLRLGKAHGWDALFFVIAQFVGGTLAVLLMAALLGPSFTAAPVSYAATLPGPAGPWVALLAEFAISAGLILVVLTLSASQHLAPFTGIAAGCLVAGYISLEAPLSGMSMNPARTFASAAPAMQWQYFWIYLCAPVIGMLAGAQLYLSVRGTRALGCAKLLHPPDTRCIHCGYVPAPGEDHASVQATPVSGER